MSMGVYIKGMEMPECCGYCPFEYKNYCMAKPSLRVEYADRHPRCPLIPVPPHGRLIDADALHRMFEEQWDYLQILNWDENPNAEAMQSGINWCINTLHDDAPTIIPAEPCNDLAKPNDTIFAVQNTDEDEWLFAAKPIDYMHTPSVEEIIKGDGE